jgi:hypothetical protein
MTITKLGTTLSLIDQYSTPENEVWDAVCKQVNNVFPNDNNLVINMTWFGPQFDNSDWYTLLNYNDNNITFDNLFFLATVDPPYLNVLELQEVKNMVSALCVYYLGNFDSPHQFNFFAPLLADNFQKYTSDELMLQSSRNMFVSYNRKPKEHRVKLVKRLIHDNLNKYGIITLGTDSTNDLLLTIDLDEPEPDIGNFGMPMVYYNLGSMEIWNNTFLYINGATEFNPTNDLFCQQDTFKPIVGMRPFVINGVQKTYRWYRHNGFKTFNHYWSHIDIENGDVHDTIIELISYLKDMEESELMSMYNDMLPDLLYNKERFYVFANEQRHKMENLF